MCNVDWKSGFTLGASFKVLNYESCSSLFEFFIKCVSFGEFYSDFIETLVQWYTTFQLSDIHFNLYIHKNSYELTYTNSHELVNQYKCVNFHEFFECMRPLSLTVLLATCFAFHIQYLCTNTFKLSIIATVLNEKMILQLHCKVISSKLLFSCSFLSHGK